MVRFRRPSLSSALSSHHWCRKAVSTCVNRLAGWRASSRTTDSRMYCTCTHTVSPCTALHCQYPGPLDGLPGAVVVLVHRLQPAGVVVRVGDEVYCDVAGAGRGAAGQTALPGPPRVVPPHPARPRPRPRPGPGQQQQQHLASTHLTLTTDKRGGGRDNDAERTGSCKTKDSSTDLQSEPGLARLYSMVCVFCPRPAERILSRVFIIDR